MTFFLKHRVRNVQQSKTWGIRFGTNLFDVNSCRICLTQHVICSVVSALMQGHATGNMQYMSASFLLNLVRLEFTFFPFAACFWILYLLVSLSNSGNKIFHFCRHCMSELNTWSRLICFLICSKKWGWMNYMRVKLCLSVLHRLVH